MRKLDDKVGVITGGPTGMALAGAKLSALFLLAGAVQAAQVVQVARHPRSSQRTGLASGQPSHVEALRGRRIRLLSMTRGRRPMPDFIVGVAGRKP